MFEQVFIEKNIAIAILNDDMSGLTDQEIDQLTEYLIELKNNPYVIGLDEYDFCVCDITGVPAECLKCELRH